MQMKSRGVCSAFAALLLMSCSDKHVSAPEPQFGRVLVLIATTGGDPDFNVHTLRIDSVVYQIPARRQEYVLGNITPGDRKSVV